ncbi:hypothetical protein ACFPK9_15865 [Rubritalea spongiae]|uniref:Uncharacterized protein n=1 Tax=Rubritalea spongiae TaxID=430797 RepID=A0ABW5E2K3_9BACT
MFLLAEFVTKLQYNSDFGGATKQLVDTSAEALQAGRYDDVSREFQKISEELDVSYEYKANYSELAEGAAESLKN